MGASTEKKNAGSLLDPHLRLGSDLQILQLALQTRAPIHERQGGKHLVLKRDDDSTFLRSDTGGSEGDVAAHGDVAGSIGASRGQEASRTEDGGQGRRGELNGTELEVVCLEGVGDSLDDRSVASVAGATPG